MNLFKRFTGGNEADDLTATKDPSVLEGKPDWFKDLYNKPWKAGEWRNIERSWDKAMFLMGKDDETARLLLNLIYDIHRKTGSTDYLKAEVQKANRLVAELRGHVAKAQLGSDRLRRRLDKAKHTIRMFKSAMQHPVTDVLFELACDKGVTIGELSSRLGLSDQLVADMLNDYKARKDTKDEDALGLHQQGS